MWSAFTVPVTWINSAEYSGLKTAMSLAGHNLTAVDSDARGRNTRVPTLLFNGALDLTYLGGLGQSIGVYNNIPRGIPKVIYEVASAGHFAWGSPTAANQQQPCTCRHRFPGNRGRTPPKTPPS